MPRERQQRLAAARDDRKDFACNAVEGYMHTMGVSLDVFIRYVEAGEQQWRQEREEKPDYEVDSLSRVYVE